MSVVVVKRPIVYNSVLVWLCLSLRNHLSLVVCPSVSSYVCHYETPNGVQFQLCLIARTMKRPILYNSVLVWSTVRLFLGVLVTMTSSLSDRLSVYNSVFVWSPVRLFVGRSVTMKRPIVYNSVLVWLTVRLFLGVSVTMKSSLSDRPSVCLFVCLSLWNALVQFRLCLIACPSVCW